MNLLARPAAALFLVAALAATTTCAAPISVEEAAVVDVYRDVTAFALTDGELSTDAEVTLERAGLRDAFDEDPVAAIRSLHALALAGDRRERLYAMAETSFVAGERTEDRTLFLASAVYAHLFLFGGGPEPAPGPFRRRFRRACDFVNVGVARAFTDPESGLFVPMTGRAALPVGALDLAPPELPVRISDFDYDDLRPAITMGISGLRARDVRSGIGTPLVARRISGSALKERRAHLAPRSAVAVTALLRFEGDLEELAAGTVPATLEFHRPTETRDVEIAGREVPLEYDTTAPLAWELADSRPWEREFTGFLDNDEAGVENEVLLTEPYVRGRIPVVLVHGTASSPARWAEVLNELHADGRVASACQFWIYQYGSGAPVLASAAGLRRGLERVVRDVDPEGTDDALRRMVVIGHSQGGLLTRLLVSESGDRFWTTVSERPFDDFDWTDSERKYVRPVFHFEPSPYVERAVFVATPHRGSYVAGNWIGKIGAALVSAPRRVVRGAGRLSRRIFRAGEKPNLESFSTAVDDMAPGSAFLAALAASPTAEGVALHSIVAVADPDDPLDEADDGVVQYVSAHLPQALSEVIVPCDHSCQGHAATVAEIRRILHEHLAAAARPRATVPPATEAPSDGR